MTIWVNRLADGVVTSDETDKSALVRHAGKLDRICRRLGVRPLSEFHDATEARAQLEEPDDPTLTGWDLLARDGAWFDPSEGLAVLDALLAHLEDTPVRFGLLSDDHGEVLRDLRDARASVAGARDAGARFHLGLVP